MYKYSEARIVTTQSSLSLSGLSVFPEHKGVFHVAKTLVNSAQGPDQYLFSVMSVYLGKNASFCIELKSVNLEVFKVYTFFKKIIEEELLEAGYGV